jgi:hypothetical protein
LHVNTARGLYENLLKGIGAPVHASGRLRPVGCRTAATAVARSVLRVAVFGSFDPLSCGLLEATLGIVANELA